MEKVNAVVCGAGLKTIRNRAGLSTRDVAQLSRQIAALKADSQFYISHAWLTDVERSRRVPSIFKLYTLSLIYQLNFSELLKLCGLDVGQLPLDRMRLPMPQSQILPRNDPILEDAFIAKSVCRGAANSDSESSPMGSTHDIPMAWRQSSDARILYARVGIHDLTLYPMVRPSSFVEVDRRQTRLLSGGTWSSEWERPIYFVEIRGGYVCGWCQQDSQDLLVVPHPLSPCQIRRFAWKKEAEVIGRVTAIENRIDSPKLNPSRHQPHPASKRGNDVAQRVRSLPDGIYANEP